jgi:hypothetical protein
MEQWCSHEEKKMSFYEKRIIALLGCSNEEAVAVEAYLLARSSKQELGEMHAILFKHEAQHGLVAVRTDPKGAFKRFTAEVDGEINAALQPLAEQMLLPVTTKTGLVLELHVDVAELDGDMVTVFVNESSIGFSLVVRRGDLKPVPGKPHKAAVLR